MAADPTTQARPGRDELSALVRAAYRAAYGERATVLDGDVTVLRAPEAPGSPFLNRVLGLGAAGQDDEQLLDAALAELAGSAVYVAVEPGAAAAGLERLLRARRFEPGWGWMRFVRGVEPSRPAPTSLRLVEVGPSEAAAFAHVVACGYDLPETILPWLARVPRSGWLAWLALAGDEPAAAAALYPSGRGGYLGFAATRPAFRGQGAQGALLAARIERARGLGCTWLATETGERLPDRPARSYRNILRAGFVETTVVANWVGTAPAAPDRGARSGRRSTGRAP